MHIGSLARSHKTWQVNKIGREGVRGRRKVWSKCKNGRKMLEMEEEKNGQRKEDNKGDRSR